jgi:hypothetical protein
MKKVLFEYVDCVKCADLERQLAEAQGKLDAVQEEAALYAGMSSTGECCGSGQAVARDILRILKEAK